MKTKRYNLEVIRMASFIAVVAIHVTNYYCRAYESITQGEYFFSMAVDVLARFSVPCFFMISGALLLGRNESLEKNGKRIRQMLLVLAVWSAVYYFWNRYYMGTPTGWKKLFYIPAEKHLWYLYVMIPVYFALPFFQILCRNMDEKQERTFLLIGTVWVVIYYWMYLKDVKPYYDLPVFGDRAYVYYVFLGYYLDKYKEKIRVGQKGLAVLFALSMALVSGLTGWETVMGGSHYDKWMGYGNPMIILASAALFVFLLRMKQGEWIPSERGRKLIDSWCACSFGIYLIHILFLDAYKKVMGPADLSAWIAVPALTAGILLLSYLSIRLLQMTPIGKSLPDKIELKEENPYAKSYRNDFFRQRKDH